MEATQDINHHSPSFMLNLILVLITLITAWVGFSWKHLHEILSVVFMALSIVSVTMIIIINGPKLIKTVKGWFK
jgi:hypothetical protein